MMTRPPPSCALLTLVTILLVTGAECQGDMAEQSSNITIRAGSDTTIVCRAGSTVTSCVWLWEYPLRDQTPTVVHGFPGHGPTSADCSVNLVNVSEIQTGWWTCRAQTGNASILNSEPIFLQVFTGPPVTFELKPVNRTFSIGSTAELECKSTIPVHSCLWSFQQEGQVEPLVVSEGPPKDGKDCSFQLENISYEQVGAWKCGARVVELDKFTYTDTVYIQVEHKEEAFPIEFVEEPQDIEMKVGQKGHLQCKIREEAHIEDCRWYWQPTGRSPTWRVLMREFLPENNDCSIEFANVTSDPEGFWTCHVKPIHSDKFKASKPAKLTVVGDLAVSTLTREITLSEGEPLTIYCIAEEPTKNCQWKWKALFNADASKLDSWVVMKTFQPSGSESRDCSLHLNHVEVEHQGMWVCSMKFQDDQPFQDAMPTVVSVKPPKKVRFVEPLRIQLAAENQSFTLNCSTLSAVDECLWLWYEDESKVTERVVKFNFTTAALNKRDCSMVIPSVERDLQGIWQCAVKYGHLSQVSYARPFSLTVVKPGPIVFRAVSGQVHAMTFHNSLLECVTREPVEQCLWLFHSDPSNQPQEISRFQPTNFNNCSLSVEPEQAANGWWTCGARNPGESNFTMATPSRMDLAKPGNVSTISLVSTNDMLMLVCQLSTNVPRVSCDWIHPSEYNVLEFNSTGRYQVEGSSETGVCALNFRPMLVDLGHWKCVFSVDNKRHVLGEASFTVLSSPQNVRLSWIVGVLATVTLVLTVLLFVVITCRFYQCSRSSKAKVQLNNPELENNKRYSEDPTKGINFSFTESPELLVDFSAPAPDTHHYERVGRFLSQRPSFYQNVN